MVARVIAVDPFDIVVFGATGDLSARKLIPALFHRDESGQIRPEARIIGASRRKLTDKGFQDLARDWLKAHVAAEDRKDGAVDRFLHRLSYISVEGDGDVGWDDLAHALADQPDRIRVFYLATGPDLFGPICAGIGRHKLNTPKSRVVVEKPIGKSLESATAVNDAIGAVFPEDRVYRIDHYLGKETVQNLMALRFANALFEPLWNNAHIDHVADHRRRDARRRGPRRLLRHRRRAARHGAEPHAAIALPRRDGAADLARRRRGARREAEGAEKPAADHAGAGDREHRARPVSRRRLGRRAGARATWKSSAIAHSRTETFVALKAEIANWRWAGVPFYLRTGKRLRDPGQRRSSSRSGRSRIRCSTATPARSTPTGW